MSGETDTVDTIAREDFEKDFFVIFRETFEGPPAGKSSVYLDQGGGLFQTIESLTPEAASESAGGAPTAAAHCEHVRFYLAHLYDYMLGKREKVDWKQTWLMQRVGPAEWEELKAGLRREYERLAGHLRAAGSLTENEVGVGMAVLTHTAYHLGAIRQIVRRPA
ncbi:MAG TPA: hypothetical protein VGX48_05410 [Pyrinomonadaceae bacterium]|nr:hypothetical protein [Pyrinomonadaceae bacterium]